MNQKAAAIRIRYLYRDMVLRKKLKLPFQASLKIVGPDCAYHLYSVANSDAFPVSSRAKARFKRVAGSR